MCMASSAIIPFFKPVEYKNMSLIDGGLFDNIPIKPLENQGYNIFSIDLFSRTNKYSKKRFNPIKSIKKTLLKQLYKNHKYSIENTNFYLGTQELYKFSLFSFKEINECFNLGVKEAKKYFETIS